MITNKKAADMSTIIIFVLVAAFVGFIILNFTGNSLASIFGETDSYIRTLGDVDCTNDNLIDLPGQEDEPTDCDSDGRPDSCDFCIDNGKNDGRNGRDNDDDGMQDSCEQNASLDYVDEDDNKLVVCKFEEEIKTKNSKCSIGPPSDGNVECYLKEDKLKNCANLKGKSYDDVKKYIDNLNAGKDSDKMTKYSDFSYKLKAENCKSKDLLKTYTFRMVDYHYKKPNGRIKILDRTPDDTKTSEIEIHVKSEVPLMIDYFTVDFQIDFEILNSNNKNIKCAIANYDSNIFMVKNVTCNGATLSFKHPQNSEEALMGTKRYFTISASYGGKNETKLISGWIVETNEMRKYLNK